MVTKNPVFAPWHHPALAPIPRTDPAHLYLQRDTAGDVGAAAGVIGAILGAGALGIAIAQLVISTHPPASASPTGGLNITHAQFGPVMGQTTPAPQGGAAPAPQGGASPAPQGGAQPDANPQLLRNDILTLRASDTSSATIALMLRTNGHDILEAYTQEQDVAGYPGGTRENANISFRSLQITGPDPTIAETALIFDGINANGDTVQRFTGRIRVRGNGQVTCETIRKTSGPGDVGGVGSAPATVTLQTPRAAAGSGSTDLMPSGGDRGFHPGDLLPFNRPMTGGQ